MLTTRTAPSGSVFVIDLIDAAALDRHAMPARELEKQLAFAAVRAAERMVAELSGRLFSEEPLAAERVVLRAELAAARNDERAAVAAWRALL